MWRGPRWSESEGGPRAHVAGASLVRKRKRPPRPFGGGLLGRQSEETPPDIEGASVVVKRERPPHPCGGVLGGPKTEEDTLPLRWAPRWSQSGGPIAHVAGASVVPKEKRPPRPCGRGPRWSQNTGGPRSHAAGPSVVPKGRRPPRLYVKCSGFQGWFGVLECTQRDTNR